VATGFIYCSLLQPVHLNITNKLYFIILSSCTYSHPPLKFTVCLFDNPSTTLDIINKRRHSVSLNPRRIAVNLDLSTQNHITCRISQDHSLYQVWTLWDNLFELCCGRQCEKCTYWPSDRELWPFNPKTISLIGYPKVIPCTKFEHFEIFLFWFMLWTNNKQTNNRVGVGNMM